MVSDPANRVQPQGEQRVVFHGMDWDSYLNLLKLLPQSRNSRLTYDNGLLEITIPLEDHEFPRCFIERFIVILVELSPDLVVEVDITHTDIAKNQFYAGLGVPEFWQFDGQIWRIYQLQSGGYVECDRPPTFPQVPKGCMSS